MTMAHRHEMEACVQMRLFVLSKRHLALVFAAFIFCFLLSVMVGLLGPDVIYTDNQIQSYQNKNPGTYSLRTARPLNSLNQQLWLLVTPVPAKGSDDEDGSDVQEGDVPITVHMYYLEDDTEQSVYRQAFNHSRHFTCTNNRCSSIVLLHLGYIDRQIYKAVVEFKDLEKVMQFESLSFEFKCYKSTFTQLELWFRFVFLTLTFITTILFSRSLKPYSWKDWSVEQKWITFLLPLLLFYNNPSFTLAFLVPSYIPSMLDGFFQATFLCSLLLYWLCVYHSIREPKRRFTRFYLPKLAIVGLVWLASVVLSTWQSVNERKDPTFNYKLDTVNFLGFKVFLAVVAAMYTLFFLYFLIRAFVELRNVAYFDVRLKFTTLLIAVVFSISLAVLILRFGTGVLNAHFVSDISTKYSSSAEFLSFYGLLNFYIYTMAFIYSPSKNALSESRLHDNPVITMLNDSDEDVVYGSDREEVFRPTSFNSRFDVDSD